MALDALYLALHPERYESLLVRTDFNGLYVWQPFGAAIRPNGPTRYDAYPGHDRATARS